MNKFTKKQVEEEFISKFCNNHNGEIRFLRSIFFDEKDGSEQILKFISKALTEQKKELQCNKCYGKGYRTELKGRRDIGNIGRGQTYSERSGKQIGSFIQKEYCDCEFGKSIEKALTEQKKELLKQVREIIKGFAYKYPPTFNKDSEWYKGYKYCQDGCKEELKYFTKEIDNIK